MTGTLIEIIDRRWRSETIDIISHCIVPTTTPDAFLIVRLPWEMKLLAKRSIMRIPLVGWQMRLAGDVAIVRGEKESARRAMEELRRWLDRRVSVFLFPEGTRSEDGTLGSFREGAFRLAIEAGVDVVPLAISGTD